MAYKLWEKDIKTEETVEEFTIGQDRVLDIMLAKYDVLGSMAHIRMLQSVGLLGKDEQQTLNRELKRIYEEIIEEGFEIEEGVEDVHSQVELMLTRQLGDAGKKIHSGRSRNDQALLDLKLFTRDRIHNIAEQIHDLTTGLLHQSNQFQDILMPGYTHLQVAMPSSFGLWFAAYAESLADDLIVLQAAYRICNRNPLGSAAGYGSSFPLNRQMTTDLLGFDSMNYNVVYAQMGRGKTERTVATAIAAVAATVSKLACDGCLFNSQNFGFITLPDRYTTGSSIMPHKKNPDVLELIRAKCNRLQALPNQITLMTNNLPSGYFRDFQTIKEIFLPAFNQLSECLVMMFNVVMNMEVNPNIVADSRYDLMFSVEEVNRRVLEGIPFRKAYQEVAHEIQYGTFSPVKTVDHTHEGSVGNLCNHSIASLIDETLAGFNFEKAKAAEQALLEI